MTRSAPTTPCFFRTTARGSSSFTLITRVGAGSAPLVSREALVR